MPETFATLFSRRRRLLQAAGALAALNAAGCSGLKRIAGGTGEAPPEPVHTNIVEDLAQRTFRFFWDTTNTKNGLTPDRWPRPSPSSVAAIGFALTAYCIGVERGYVTREQARARTLLT